MRTSIAILALGLLGSEQHQSAALQDKTRWGDANGWTVWQCYPGSYPAGFVAVNVLDTPDEAIVAAHERDHVRWMLARGSCWAAKLALHTRGGRLEAEASGFCAGARAAVLVGRSVSLGAAIEDASSTLAGSYGFDISKREAERAIRRACGLP